MRPSHENPGHSHLVTADELSGCHIGPVPGIAQALCLGVSGLHRHPPRGVHPKPPQLVTSWGDPGVSSLSPPLPRLSFSQLGGFHLDSSPPPCTGRRSPGCWPLHEGDRGAVFDLVTAI